MSPSMTDSRAQILSAVQDALKSVRLPGATPNHPINELPYSQGGVDQFMAEIERLSGRAIRVKSMKEARRTILTLFREQGWTQALGWTWDAIGCEELDRELREVGVEVRHEGPLIELASLPVGLTGADAALADTGTLILRHGPGRTPLASLLPPVHIALLDARRVFSDMVQYFVSLANEGGAPHVVASTSNLIFLSGPSRTADIEQTLTLGAHGPKEVIVVIYEQGE